jgi:two-component system response regulator AtoC
VATAINLLKNGAFDYIVKDDDTKDRLWNSILHLREISNLKQEVETLKSQVGRKYDFSQMIIGKSEQIEKVFSMIEKAAKTNITVSVTGETGSGKEMIAKAIHYNSDRHKLPFVAVNVAAIPKDLIESELFGHEKGALRARLPAGSENSKRRTKAPCSSMRSGNWISTCRQNCFGYYRSGRSPASAATP